ncbi:MAG: hypothetical protein R3E39_26475 [Anaerolineae bacterium]
MLLEWNVAHIAKHDVTRLEAEQIFTNDHAVRQTYGNRLLVFGMTEQERVLAIILHPKPESRYYVVSARPANRQERRDYQQELNEGGDAA